MTPSATMPRIPGKTSGTSIRTGRTPSAPSARASPRSTRMAAAMPAPIGAPTSTDTSRARAASSAAKGAASPNGTSGATSQGRSRIAPAPAPSRATTPIAAATYLAESVSSGRMACGKNTSPRRPERSFRRRFPNGVAGRGIEKQREDSASPRQPGCYVQAALVPVEDYLGGPMRGFGRRLCAGSVLVGGIALTHSAMAAGNAPPPATPTAATGKGVVGGALLGAEAVMLTEAAADVK